VASLAHQQRVSTMAGDIMKNARRRRHGRAGGSQGIRRVAGVNEQMATT